MRVGDPQNIDKIIIYLFSLEQKNKVLYFSRPAAVKRL